MSPSATYLIIALGGALGACARFFLSSTISGGRFPLATFLVNVTGCFAIGLLSTWLGGKAPATEALRLLLVTGFLGAYTTFSAFGLENQKLLESGAWELAAAYIAASVFLGILAVKWGAACARMLG